MTPEAIGLIVASLAFSNVANILLILKIVFVLLASCLSKIKLIEAGSLCIPCSS